ncbi:hypothetical protein HanIR_Chr13g0657651 [Helianthus annuus]|nr:hypothetical protein HanIR_Chr13g0657651 [Helianthus annuus]
MREQRLTMTKPRADLYIPHERYLYSAPSKLKTQYINIFGVVPSGLGWRRISPSTKAQARNNNSSFRYGPYKIILPTGRKARHVLVAKSFPESPLFVYRVSEFR